MTNVGPAGDADEPRRLAALHSYDILDTPPEAEFDDIVQMAAQACGTAMAHINFIDADRQWIKAAIGHEVREMPRHLGFCTNTMETGDLLILSDLSLRPEFTGNLLIDGPPHLRFYAGVPLKTRDGLVIGTLCVLDRRPQTLSDQQIFILRALARTVMTQLEMRRTDHALRRSEARLSAGEARQAFLLGLTDTIRTLAGPHAIMSAAVEAIGRHLRIDRAGYGSVRPDGRTVVQEACYTAGGGPVSDDGSKTWSVAWLDRLRAGATVVARGIGTGRSNDPSNRPTDDGRACVAVPVIRGDRLTAILYAVAEGPRGWTRDDVSLIEDVAARTWDAVERAGAEASKRETTTRHRQILDSAVDYAIIAFDRDGRVTEWNEGARRILGWDEAEMLGETAERFFTPEDRIRGEVEAEMRRARDTGVGNDERWHLRKGGERFWASGEMRPLRDEAGTTIGFVKVLRDRTADELAREALDEIRQRQEIALDTGRVGFFDWNIEKGTIEGDARFVDFFGLAQEAVAAGISLVDVMNRVHEADRETVSRHIEAAIASLGDYAQEYRVRTDGEDRWLIARGRCYASAHDRPLRYAGTVIDITERKDTEARLRESEERYATLFRSIDAGFAIIEVKFEGDRAVDYRFVEVNPAFEHQTGLVSAVGGWASELVPGLERHWYDTYGRVAATGEPVRFENGAEAMERWFDVSAFRVGDPAARRVALLFTDISDRRRLELQLRRLNANLGTQVVERTAERDRVWLKARDLFAIVDRSGIFIAVNPAWEATLGFRADEIVGRNFGEFLAPEDRERSRAAHETATRQSVSNFENRYRHFDGSLRTIAWQTSVEGERVYAYGRDVTAERERQSELAQAQEALRQSQKMEAVGQLTGGVAHDFNNLLTIIRSSVDFLRRPDLPEDRRRRYMDAVSDTVERAAKLTGQLLAFARRQALKPEVFEVGDRLGGVADMLDTVTGARISVRTHVPDQPCFIRADISQFETALVNMAVNARDAMNGEGTLTLRLVCSTPMPALRGHAGARGPFAAVSLHDTGSGIEPDVLAHIFEPFFTTKEVGRGTGLGLSQVFGFAKQSGGDVAVESEPGTGTTFTLFLPEIAAPERFELDGPTEPDLLSDGTGRRILVVEDNIEVGRFATQILQDLGYATAWAANAEEALEALGSDGAGFDAVFSDVVMPGMGGVALAEELRRRMPDLPVVLASGYSHVLAQEGAHGFELLHKPYSAEQLSRILRRACARGRHATTG